MLNLSFYNFFIQLLLYQEEKFHQRKPPLCFSLQM
nr:MAG TPA: hypothetical protein [Caudoviricetes sp.]